jgi:hypothetical protein
MTNDTFYDFESDLLAELRAIDHRTASARVHRRPALRTFVPWAGLGGAVAAATAVTLTLVGGSAGSFAGWTAAASAATVPQTASASAICGLNPDNVILSQVRGSYTVVMTQSGGVTTACLANSAQLAVVSTQQLASGGTLMTMTGNASGALDTWSGETLGTDPAAPNAVTGHMDVAGEGPLTVVDGQAPAGATAMTVVCSDGTNVEATVENGEFFAWWPGATNPTTAVVTAASGTTDLPFVIPPSVLGSATPSA